MQVSWFYSQRLTLMIFEYNINKINLYHLTICLSIIYLCHLSFNFINHISSIFSVYHLPIIYLHHLSFIFIFQSYHLPSTYLSSISISPFSPSPSFLFSSSLLFFLQYWILTTGLHMLNKRSASEPHPQLLNRISAWTLFVFPQPSIYRRHHTAVCKFLSMAGWMA